MNTVIFLAVFAAAMDRPAMHIPSLTFATLEECQSYRERFERNAKSAGFLVRTYCSNGRDGK